MLQLLILSSINFWDINSQLLSGFSMTILLFFVTFILAIPLGMGFCYMRMRKNIAISSFMKGLIYVIRSTPLMLQIIVFFYAPGLLFGWSANSRVITVIFSLAFNYAIYFCEIFRSGYENVAVGQRLAGETLGLSKIEILFKIYMAQIIKNIIPPMSNETISLVKDTALARVIAVTEVIFAAQKIVSTYAIIWVLFYTGVFYLLFNALVTFAYSKLEKKLSYIRV